MSIKTCSAAVNAPVHIDFTDIGPNTEIRDTSSEVFFLYGFCFLEQHMPLHGKEIQPKPTALLENLQHS